MNNGTDKTKDIARRRSNREANASDREANFGIFGVLYVKAECNEMDISL